MSVNKVTFIVKLSIFGFVLVWAVLNILAPYLAPADTIDFGCDGVVGGHEHEDQINDIENRAARFMYNSGDSACHQRNNRSLFLNGNQMPYCARDVAIFIGLAVGMGISLFFVPEITFWLLLVGYVPIGIDGTTQLLTDYESNNFLRVGTGLLAGIVTAFLIAFIALEYVKLIMEWKQGKQSVPEPPPPDVRPDQTLGTLHSGTLEEDIQPPIEQNEMLNR